MDVDTAHHLTAKKAERRLQVTEMQREVEKLSDNGIEFKARILRGHGSHWRIGGMWPSRDVNSFLKAIDKKPFPEDVLLLERLRNLKAFDAEKE